MTPDDFYASLVRSMDAGFCILEPVRDGRGRTVDFRIVDINPAFEHQSGLLHAVGRTVRELQPDAADAWVDFFDAVPRDGEAVRINESTGPMGRLFDVQATHIGGSGRDLVGVLFRNVTERTQQEEALRQSEARYRRLFETMDEGFCIIEMVDDAQGRPLDYRFIETNPSFERHTGLRGAVGRTMRELVPRHEPYWFQTYARVARTGQPVRFQNEAAALGRWFDVYAFPAGDPGRVAVLFTDISARVRAEVRLKQQDRRKDEFLAMLAHELRNPLAPIGAAAELLERGATDPQRVRHASAIIRRQVGHMTGLVDDLLDVSRVTRGLVALEKTRVDAARVVAEALEQVRPLLEMRRHTLALHTSVVPACVLGDHERLLQVVANLLTNAAKYTPEGGRIGVDLEVGDGQVTLTVSDNGIGIAPAFLTSAFELFAQAERSADRSQGGLGIGLALVRSLVGLHGGAVEASSEGLGRGSRFTVRLPALAAPTMIAPAAAPLAAAPAANLRPLRVMVVDDNTDAAETLGMLIEAMGHRATVELGARQALERAQKEAFDVFLLDIGLPDMNGHALARRLRDLPAGRDAVLVAVTGYGQEQDRAQALAAGFDHHFVKPVEPARLEALLAGVAAG